MALSNFFTTVNYVFQGRSKKYFKKDNERFWS